MGRWRGGSRARRKRTTRDRRSHEIRGGGVGTSPRRPWTPLAQRCPLPRKLGPRTGRRPLQGICNSSGTSHRRRARLAGSAHRAPASHRVFRTTEQRPHRGRRSKRDQRAAAPAAWFNQALQAAVQLAAERRVVGRLMKIRFNVAWQFQVDGTTFEGSVSSLDSFLIEPLAQATDVIILYDPPTLASTPPGSSSARPRAGCRRGCSRVEDQAGLRVAVKRARVPPGRSRRRSSRLSRPRGRGWRRARGRSGRRRGSRCAGSCCGCSRPSRSP